MDVVGKKIENQVQFWSLLGPCLILLAIGVLIFKVSPHWYFPVSAIIGIPLCVKWKMKGMAAALCSLLLFSSIGYQDLELDERYWHVGLAMAMAFSFIIMTLALEEVHAVIHKLHLESQSRLDNFVLLDEKWKMAEQEWQQVKESSKVEINSLAQEIARSQEEKQTFHKLAELSKDELIQVRGQHDLLLQDLFYKKQQIAQMNERLEETELSLQAFVNSDSEKQISTLAERVASAEREKETLKAKIATLQSDGQACMQHKEQLTTDLKNSQERERACLKQTDRLQTEQLEQKSLYQELHRKCATLEEERNALHRAHNGVRQQCEQMRTQEGHLRQLMQHSSLKMQELQSQLVLEEQEKEVLQIKVKDLEERFASQKKQAASVEDAYQVAQLETHQRHLKELESKNQAVLEMQQKLHQMSDELNEQQNLASQAHNQIERLEQTKNELELALTQLQEQLKNTQQLVESSPPAPRNNRQMEGLYLQLRKQFQEKCSVLDETRRQLFHTNEQILKQQKKQDEEQIFDQSPSEKWLFRNLIKMGKHYEKREQQYQQEIDQLTHLISHLLQK